MSIPRRTQRQLDTMLEIMNEKDEQIKKLEKKAQFFNEFINIWRNVCEDDKKEALEELYDKGYQI